MKHQTPDHPRYPDFTFFRDFADHPTFKAFECLLGENGQSASYQDLKTAYFTLKADVSAYALSRPDDGRYAKALWHDFVLARILADDNPLTRLFEKEQLSPTHPFYPSMIGDLRVLLSVYHFDWQTFLDENPLDTQNIFELNIFDHIKDEALHKAFDQNDETAAFTALNAYVLRHGLGIFESHQCFKIDDATGALVPIPRRQYKPMTSLIGYDLQKNQLTDNTRAFVEHRAGLNALLKGDMGTGKSTMVKALLDTFADTDLRMIEITKEQISALPAIISAIKDRPYAFIIFVDDLSFDDKENDFKRFKNVLEGSLEDNTPNVRIYATSNKRHLVSESMSERTDAVHAKDVMEEKLSLSSRFGLVLSFTAPNQKEYLTIVREMAKTAGITMRDDDLTREAITWELRHLNRSGRTAEQFITHLIGNGETN